MGDLRLRVAQPPDGEAIASIYRPYVQTTAVTFDKEPPRPASIANAIEQRIRTYPWLVAEIGSRVVGYAYASSIRSQEAYRWTVELSIYLDRSERDHGIGSALYTALLGTLTRQRFVSAYGVITVPNPESVGFHESLGFQRVGRFPNVGYKLGRWHDVAWYVYTLDQHDQQPDSPNEPIPFEDCRNTAWLEQLCTTAAESSTVQ